MSVSGGYANILFTKARAAGAAAAASAGGGSTAVQPRVSGSTAPLPSSTGLNRVKPLCEVPDPNEHVEKKQETNTGAKAKMPDHYRCTITSAFCGKRKHYKDECYHKQRLSAKLKGKDPGKGSGKGGGKGNGNDSGKGKSKGRGKGQDKRQG